MQSPESLTRAGGPASKFTHIAVVMSPQFLTSFWLEALIMHNVGLSMYSNVPLPPPPPPQEITLCHFYNEDKSIHEKESLNTVQTQGKGNSAPPFEGRSIKACEHILFF